jgi:uncharacterized protein
MIYVPRKREAEALDRQFNRTASAFIAIYGRRRIGKTYFVRQYCRENNIILLEFTGYKDRDNSFQLQSFIEYINELQLELPLPAPSNWREAATILHDFILQHYNNKKVVIFFDETPWLDAPRSDFKEGLKKLWDKNIDHDPNIHLIVCGSAATYMLDKFVNHKGDFHNRATKTIEMKPFNLHQVKDLFQQTGWSISDKSIIDLYIAFGGVAKYLSDLEVGLSPEQAINEACFISDAKYKYEYDILFHSLFDKAQTHYAIMNYLTTKWDGFLRSDIGSKVKFSATIVNQSLKELEASGFVNGQPYFGKKNMDKIFLASDMFSYFHHKWIKDGRTKDWLKKSRSRSYTSWGGFAFEKVCHLHTYQIKKKLGINGIETESHYWRYIPTDDSEEGAQIDVMLEWKDGSKNIEIIECKYSDSEFTISKGYCEDLKRKIRVFNKQTNYKYNLRLTLVTTHGVKINEYFNELAPRIVTMTDLFESEP